MLIFGLLTMKIIYQFEVVLRALVLYTGLGGPVIGFILQLSGPAYRVTMVGYRVVVSSYIF